MSGSEAMHAADGHGSRPLVNSKLLAPQIAQLILMSTRGRTGL
jgi:hypothetical protein